MDWTAVGALGEVVGAGAVVASLLYLGRQIKHSAKVTAVEGIEASASKMVDWSLTISASPQLADLVIRVQIQGARRDDLSQAERGQAGYLYFSVLMNQAGMFERWRAGLMSEEAFRDYVGRTTGFLGAPYLKDVWPHMRGSFPDRYRDFVERTYALRELPPESGTV